MPMQVTTERAELYRRLEVAALELVNNAEKGEYTDEEVVRQVDLDDLRVVLIEIGHTNLERQDGN